MPADDTRIRVAKLCEKQRVQDRRTEYFISRRLAGVSSEGFGMGICGLRENVRIVFREYPQQCVLCEHRRETRGSIRVETKVRPRYAQQYLIDRDREIDGPEYTRKCRR